MVLLVFEILFCFMLFWENENRRQRAGVDARGKGDKLISVGVRSADHFRLKFPDMTRSAAIKSPG